MTLIGPLAPSNLFTNQALTISGGATPSATSERTALVTALKDQALEQAKIHAQNAAALAGYAYIFYHKVS